MGIDFNRILGCIAVGTLHPGEHDLIDQRFLSVFIRLHNISKSDRPRIPESYVCLILLWCAI